MIKSDRRHIANITKDTSNSSSVLRIQCCIYLIKKIEGCRITSLYGKYKCQGNNSFLTPWQLLHGLCLPLPSKGNLPHQKPFWIIVNLNVTSKMKWKMLPAKVVKPGSCRRQHFVSLVLTPKNPNTTKNNRRISNM